MTHRLFAHERKEGPWAKGGGIEEYRYLYTREPEVRDHVFPALASLWR